MEYPMHLNLLRASACAALAMFAPCVPGAARACTVQDDVVLADFEEANYGSWSVTGTAFGTAPAHGTLPNQMPVTGYVGKGLVNSFYGGDASTGTLTSPIFKIERSYINFLVGGGHLPGQTGVRLIIDGVTVRSTTGTDSERLDWCSWDVKALEGKTARIEIFDNATGGWGHINVDQITLSDVRKAPIIMKDSLYAETYRPQFHFSARKNWLNDPNGLVYYRGEYHLFFQHNPEGINWGNMTWGHAVSPDLLHWTQLENALLPDKFGTIFSGSAVIDWHNTTGFGSEAEPPMVAMYTAAGGTNPESKGVPFSQCLAYSTDKGRTFTKYEHNPVVAHIAGENRDPKLVWFAPTKTWVMALYLDKEDFGLFTSPDLKTWKQIQTLSMPGSSECPDFFEIKVAGENTHKWVFTAANGHYYVGDFDGAQFKLEPGFTPQIPDFGANYYAVQTYSDVRASDGRRIQIAWMNGGTYPEMPFNQQMSFPCELTLHRLPQGLRLFRYPVKEIESLYSETVTHTKSVLQPGENAFASDASLTGDLYDIDVQFEPGNSEKAIFSIRGEQITYNCKEHTVSFVGKTARLAPQNGHVRMRLLIDKASIELFGNGGQMSMTSCFVPSPEHHEITLSPEGGEIRINSLKARTLKSTSPGVH
jgi:fructan beta-fructosidase